MWTVNIGDTVIEPTRALDLTRNLIGANRLERLDRVRQRPGTFTGSPGVPDAGDTLFVVTALAPARGIIAEQVSSNSMRWLRRKAW